MFWIIIQLEYSPSAKLLESGRHFVRYILVYLQEFMMASIKIIFHTLYARIQPISSHSHLCAWLSRRYIHFDCPGQVHVKHAGPHLSRTNLSWAHLTKQRAPEAKSCSFVLKYFLNTIHRGWCYAMCFTLPELWQKLQFPLITTVPSPMYMPVCVGVFFC